MKKWSCNHQLRHRDHILRTKNIIQNQFHNLQVEVRHQLQRHYGYLLSSLLHITPIYKLVTQAILWWKNNRQWLAKAFVLMNKSITKLVVTYGNLSGMGKNMKLLAQGNWQRSTDNFSFRSGFPFGVHGGRLSLISESPRRESPMRNLSALLAPHAENPPVWWVLCM